MARTSLHFMAVLNKYRNVLWLRLSYKRSLMAIFTALTILIIIQTTGIYERLNISINLLVTTTIVSLCLITFIYSRPDIRQIAWIADANLANNNSLFTTAIFLYLGRKSPNNIHTLYSQANQIQFNDLRVPKYYRLRLLHSFILVGIFIFIYILLNTPLTSLNLPANKTGYIKPSENTVKTDSDFLLRQLENIKQKIAKSSPSSAGKSSNHSDIQDNLENSTNNKINDKAMISRISFPHIKLLKVSSPHAAHSVLNNISRSKLHENLKPYSTINNMAQTNPEPNNSISRAAAKINQTTNNEHNYTNNNPREIQLVVTGDINTTFHDQHSSKSTQLRTSANAQFDIKKRIIEIHSNKYGDAFLSHLMPYEREYLKNFNNTAH